MRQRILILLANLALLLPLLLHAPGAMDLRLLDTLERYTYDLRINLDLATDQDPRIVIVDIDESSLARIGRWPWPRDLLARLVDTLFDDYGIAVLGFDVVFAEPDETPGDRLLRELLPRLAPDQHEAMGLQQPVDDMLLARDSRFAMSLAARPVVLGYYFRGEGDDTPSIGMLPEPVLDSALPAARWLYRPASHGGNLPELQEAVPSAGFINNPLFDADGVLRRVPLLQAYGDGLYESLALAVTRAALGYPPIDLPSPDDNGEYPPEWLYVGATGVPVDAQAAVLVPYRGRQGSFPYVPAADVLDGSAAAETLAGSIVLIGTTAPGLLDLRATPVQNVYAGVEVHANVIAGILDGRIRHRPDWTLGLELLLLVFIALLLGLVLPRLSPLYMTLTAVAALIAVVGTNLLAWRLDLVLPLASPVLLVLLLTMLYIAHGFFITTRHKRALARRFGQYVPPELVEEMSQRPEDFSTAGESREMTVLFSDVRGFTSISEGLEARQLTRLMNELLTPMTRVIHDHRGTIDKYMGDAIMAFWGAPLRDPEHARHALDAALDMQRVLHAMQPTFKQRGWPSIRMGIGLNTGTMSVGNMGSEFRMAYTVLGDAVNLGSRLEGLSSVYGVDIIVSDATRAQVSDHVFRELDLVRVKGKDRPVAIFEPLGPASRLDAAVGAELERHHGALALYRHADWDGAETAFRALAEDFPERKVYAIYLERIDAFRQNPPGPDWDGVFVHRSK